MDRLLCITDYVPSHLVGFDFKSIHDSERVTEIVGPALTFFYQDKPIAIIGGFLLHKGVMQGWSYLSDGIGQCPIRFHKAMKAMIDFAFDKHGLNRMQIVVRVRYTQGRKWAKALGFVCEGIMINYGTDGTDYSLFARYK